MASSLSTLANLYTSQSTIEHHAAAPLLEERERFIHHRIEQGFSGKKLQNFSARILQGIRFLNLDTPRLITLVELDAAAERWAVDTAHHHKSSAPGRTSAKNFKEAVRMFLIFSNLLELPRAPFETELVTYLEAMSLQRKLSFATVRSHEKTLRHFLCWFAARAFSLRALSYEDLREYLRVKGETIHPSTLFNAGSKLRAFVQFGEGLGWFAERLHTTIRVRACRNRLTAEDVPSWPEVRRMLDADIGSAPGAYRNRAMMLLCSVYGLRSSEVVSLRLSDLNWTEETMTITRAKGGRVQLFPIQYEIGVAVLTYITIERPPCNHQQVFISLKRPYRPAIPMTLGNVTAQLMAKLNIKSVKRGPHSLRHACATELLRTGSSLKQIADFLGHKNLKTVGTYAKCSPDSLRLVGAFGLKGLL